MSEEPPKPLARGVVLPLQPGGRPASQAALPAPGTFPRGGDSAALSLPTVLPDTSWHPLPVRGSPVFAFPAARTIPHRRSDGTVHSLSPCAFHVTRGHTRSSTVADNGGTDRVPRRRTPLIHWGEGLHKKHLSSC